MPLRRLVWLDGLDIPLIQDLDASFSEHRPDKSVMPTVQGDAPQFIFPYRQWRDALGSGTHVVDGATHAIVAGDIFVTPPWAERRFAAETDLVLFSYSDRAVQQALGLWREALL